MGGTLLPPLAGNLAGFTVACFAAGTPLVVDFEGNSRSIEEIEVGDYVLARSEFDAAGPLELKRVEEKFVRVAPVMELVVRGQVITTTAEHPFYVAGEERFVPAGELTLNHALVDSQGFPVAIEAIRPTDRLITVYNLRVADFHTYFVGGRLWQFDAWVHNASYAPSSAATPRGYVSGFSEIMQKARAAKAGDLGALGEIEAAKVLRSQGRNVHFQTPTGRRGPTTADFLVDGVPYDVFTPVTKNPGNVIKGIFNKDNQAPNILLNMRHTPVRPEELGDIVGRVNSFHPDFPGRIQRVEVIR